MAELFNVEDRDEFVVPNGQHSVHGGEEVVIEICRVLFNESYGFEPGVNVLQVNLAHELVVGNGGHEDFEVVALANAHVLEVVLGDEIGTDKVHVVVPVFHESGFVTLHVAVLEPVGDRLKGRLLP